MKSHSQSRILAGKWRHNKVSHLLLKSIKLRRLIAEVIKEEYQKQARRRVEKKIELIRQSNRQVIALNVNHCKN